MLTQVHPSLAAKDDSLDYVESLILKLLQMLTSKPAPQSVQVGRSKVSLLLSLSDRGIYSLVFRVSDHMRAY